MKNFILGTILVFFNCAIGQSNLHFQHYTAFDGLPSNETYCSIQDHEGYMWFGTDHGVSRWNGFEFQNFTIQDGLSGNVVLNMQYDQFGRLWFVCYNGKLTYFENNRFYKYKYNDILVKHGAGISLLKTIHVFSDGSLLIGSMNSQSIRISKEGMLEKVSDKDESIRLLFDPLTDRTQLLYTLDQRMIDPSKKYFLGIKNNEYNTRKVLLPAGINTLSHTMLSTNEESEFYINVGSKLLIINQETDTVINFEKPIVFVLSEDERIWLGMLGGGVYSINKKDYSIQYNYLKGSTVSSVYKDRNDSYWFTTTNNGIYYSINDHFFSLSKMVCSKFINIMRAI
ncbi:hypothetical protein OAV92_02660 [Crocinitomicaceae bacterium]|nr:hypothetical protein [Crocinitomicaceae bacterium]